jgi:hypothetical protein
MSTPETAHFLFHWSNPMASKHQIPNDREFFALMRGCDRSIRQLQRAADREAHLLREIGYWQSVQKDSSPESPEYEDAMQHIMRLLDSPPNQDTWRDELADHWNSMVWSVKEAAFASLRMVMIIVFNVVWWTFLIFVALPIVWNWFWQLPPGLK